MFCVFSLVHKIHLYMFLTESNPTVQNVVHAALHFEGFSLFDAKLLLEHAHYNHDKPIQNT